MSDWLEEYLGELPDPRLERTRRHKLIDIIGVAVCAVIGGADNYISSLGNDADLVLVGVRAPWAIENRWHWVLDVMFREGQNRYQAGAEAANMALLRRPAINW